MVVGMRGVFSLAHDDAVFKESKLYGGVDPSAYELGLLDCTGCLERIVFNLKLLYSWQWLSQRILASKQVDYFNMLSRLRYNSVLHHFSIKPYIRRITTWVRAGLILR